MTQFSRFSVGSFKAFDRAQSLAIRPLTLLFGPNSAGKSSVIHALAYLHEAMGSGVLDVRHPRIGGSAIDLGGFPKFVHRRLPTTRPRFAMEFDGKALPAQLEDLLDKRVEQLGISLTVGGVTIEREQRSLFDSLDGAGSEVAVTEISVELDGEVALRSDPSATPG